MTYFLYALGISVVLCPSLLWADVKVIYRKSDGIVGAYCYNDGRQANCVQDELRNIPQSQLGGTFTDYAVLDVSEQVWAQYEGGRKKATVDPMTQQLSFTLRPTLKTEEGAPIEIPLEDFGAGLAGAAAALAGQGFIVRARKKKVETPPV